MSKNSKPDKEEIGKKRFSYLSMENLTNDKKDIDKLKWMIYKFKKYYKISEMLASC